MHNVGTGSGDYSSGSLAAGPAYDNRDKFSGAQAGQRQQAYWDYALERLEKNSQVLAALHEQLRAKLSPVLDMRENVKTDIEANQASLSNTINATPHPISELDMRLRELVGTMDGQFRQLNDTLRAIRL